MDVYSSEDFKLSMAVDRLHLIVLPTEQCNFRCTYCYEDFLLGEMEDKISDNILALIENRGAILNKLQLDFFGGEPLLAKNVIFKISEKAFKLSKKYNFYISGQVTTNASLLTVATLKKLCEYGIKSFQISLDGYGEQHNKTRKYANGKGSFDIIWKRITDACKTDINFEFAIRLHVTEENKSEIGLLSKKIDEYFSKDKRIVKKINGIGNLKKQNNTESEHDKHHAKNLYAKEESVDSNKVFATKKSLKEFSFICYAARPNSLVIRSNGDLAKCTVAFNNPKNKVGKISQGGNLLIDKNKRNKLNLKKGVSVKKKLLTLCLLSCVSHAEEINLNAFTELEMNQAFSYTVQASDRNAIIIDKQPHDFTYKQSGRKVSIGIDQVNGNNPPSSGAAITVLTQQPLSAVTTTTYADVTVEKNTCNPSHLSVESNTGSRLLIKGHTTDLKLDVSTNAELNALGYFTADRADMTVSTSAKANLPQVTQSGNLDCSTFGVCRVKKGSNLKIQQFLANVIID